jgi:NADH dehydrogenase [ubiquinone] 1 alpha subcomplex assembly factor 1
MAGADEPSRDPLSLWTFNSKDEVAQFATGCDGDIGGTSTVHLELDESSAVAGTSTSALNPPRPSAKFWGEMRLAARAGFEGRVRGGYAGFRSKVSF